MRYGTEAQKRELLPRILTGDLHFSIGYSEPESGTDLASLRAEAGPGSGPTQDLLGLMLGTTRPETGEAWTTSTSGTSS